MKTRYTTGQAVMAAARALHPGNGDHSATTIRCCINDLMDNAEKNGYQVNHDYDQPRAVAAVKRLLATVREVAR